MDAEPENMEQHCSVFQSIPCGAVILMVSPEMWGVCAEPSHRSLSLKGRVPHCLPAPLELNHASGVVTTGTASGGLQCWEQGSHRCPGRDGQEHSKEMHLSEAALFEGNKVQAKGASTCSQFYLPVLIQTLGHPNLQLLISCCSFGKQ